jgi:hypothetical protein
MSRRALLALLTFLLAALAGCISILSAFPPRRRI